VRQDRQGPDFRSVKNAGKIYRLHIAAAVPNPEKCNNALETHTFTAQFTNFADGNEISAIGLTTFLWPS
jgi:hypothetical protein